MPRKKRPAPPPPPKRKRRPPKPAVPARCGDFGGRCPDGSPCEHEAGWGRGTQTGRCVEHDEAAVARMQQHKETVLSVVADPMKHLKQAAAAVGVDVATLYRWRQADPVFDAAVTSAMEERDRMRAHLLEDSVFGRCLAGKAAPGLEIFYLKNLAPDRFSDRRTIAHEGSIEQILRAAASAPVTDDAGD